MRTRADQHWGFYLCQGSRTEPGPEATRKLRIYLSWCSVGRMPSQGTWLGPLEPQKGSQNCVCACRHMGSLGLRPTVRKRAACT